MTGDPPTRLSQMSLLDKQLHLMVPNSRRDMNTQSWICEGLAIAVQGLWSHLATGFPSITPFPPIFLTSLAAKVTSTTWRMWAVPQLGLHPAVYTLRQSPGDQQHSCQASGGGGARGPHADRCGH